MFHVYPNAIDPNEEQYKGLNKKSFKRITFWFVMGSAHEKKRIWNSLKGVLILTFQKT